MQSSHPQPIQTDFSFPTISIKPNTQLTAQNGSPPRYGKQSVLLIAPLKPPAGNRTKTHPRPYFFIKYHKSAAHRVEAWSNRSQGAEGRGAASKRPPSTSPGLKRPRGLLTARPSHSAAFSQRGLLTAPPATKAPPAAPQSSPRPPARSLTEADGRQVSGGAACWLLAAVGPGLSSAARSRRTRAPATKWRRRSQRPPSSRRPEHSRPKWRRTGAVRREHHAVCYWAERL